MTDLANASPSAPPGRILTLDEIAERVQLEHPHDYRAILASDLEASQLTQRRGGWRVYESALEELRCAPPNGTRLAASPPGRRPAVQPGRRPPGAVDDARAPAGGTRLVLDPQMGRRAA